MASSSAQRSPLSVFQAISVLWLASLTVAVAFTYARGNRIATPASSLASSAGEITFTPAGFEHPAVRLTGAMPDPQVGGQTFPRSNVVAGLQFLDSKGDEMGGLGAILVDRKAMMLCFDHSTAEAVCLTRFGKDVMFSIMEPPADGAQVGVPGPQRFAFGVLPDEGVSYLRLMDRQGQVRIRMEVDAEGQPVIETMDENGTVEFTTRR